MEAILESITLKLVIQSSSLIIHNTIKLHSGEYIRNITRVGINPVICVFLTPDFLECTSLTFQKLSHDNSFDILIVIPDHLWKVNIGSCNGMEPPGNKPILEPVLTKMHQLTSLLWSLLNTLRCNKWSTFFQQNCQINLVDEQGVQRMTTPLSP